MNRNQMLTLAAVAFGAVASLGRPTLAADATSTDAPAAAVHQGQRGHRMGLAQMAKDLNLSDDQQAKIKTIQEDSRTRTQAIRSDTSLTADDKRTKIQAIRKDTQQKLNDVLNDDQRAKLKTLRAAAAEQRRAQAGATTERHTTTELQHDTTAKGAGVTADAAKESHANGTAAAGRRGIDWASLNLTDDQQAKIKAIHEDATKQIQSVRDSSATDDDKRQKVQAIHRDSMSKIRDLLNDDQKAKLQTMMQNARQRAPSTEKAPASK